MAIASVGTLGTSPGSTSSSTHTHTTATNTLSAGQYAILILSTDNLSTVDGQTNNHVSVSGTNMTFTKLGEYTNSPTGAAADGACCSVWLGVASGTVGTSSTWTVTLSGAVTDRISTAWKFTASNLGATYISGFTNYASQEVNGANGFGSSTLNPGTSKSRLWVRGMAKEANTTTALTVTAGYTAITANRSRNSSLAIYGTGEFIIATATTQTSNPTLAVNGDTASVMVVLEESPTQPVTGAFIASGSALYQPAVKPPVTSAADLAATYANGLTRVGPFYYNSSYYYVGTPVFSGVTQGRLAMVKLAHATSVTLGSVTECDVAGSPVCSSNGVLFPQTYAIQVGNTVHIVYGDSAATPSLFYVSFDLTTETWSAVTTLVTLANIQVDYVNLVVRSNGDIVVGYAVGGGSVYYAIKPSGGAWSSGNVVYSSSYVYGPMRTYAVGNRVYFCFTADLSGTAGVAVRVLNASNSLGTTVTVRSGGSSYHATGGAPFKDIAAGASALFLTVSSPTSAGGAGEIWYYKMTDADTPTVSYLGVLGSALNSDMTQVVGSTDHGKVLITSPDNSGAKAGWWWTYDSQVGLSSATSYNSGQSTGAASSLYSRSGLRHAYMWGVSTFLTNIVEQTLADPVYGNSITGGLVLYAGGLASQSVSGAFISDASVLYTGTIAAGAVGVTGSFLSAVSVTYAGSLTPGSVSVTGEFTGSGLILYSGTVAVAAPTVTGATIAGGTVTYAGSLATGPVSVVGAFFNPGASLYAGSVVQTIIGATLGSTIVLYEGTVRPNVGGALIASGAVMYAGIVTSIQLVTGGTVGSTVSMYTGAVTVGAVGVTGSTLPSGVMLFDGTVVPAPVLMTGAFIASGLAMYTGVVVDASSVTGTVLSSTAAEILYQVYSQKIGVKIGSTVKILTVPLTVGAWSLVHVVVHADGTYTFYVNGTVNATFGTGAVGDPVWPASVTAGSLIIGSGGAMALTGSLDEMAIYPDELTAGQIATRYALRTSAPVYGVDASPETRVGYARVGYAEVG